MQFVDRPLGIAKLRENEEAGFERTDDEILDTLLALPLPEAIKFLAISEVISGGRPEMETQIPLWDLWNQYARGEDSELDQGSLARRLQSAGARKTSRRHVTVNGSSVIYDLRPIFDKFTPEVLRDYRTMIVRYLESTSEIGVSSGPSKVESKYKFPKCAESAEPVLLDETRFNHFLAMFTDYYQTIMCMGGRIPYSDSHKTYEELNEEEQHYLKFCAQFLVQYWATGTIPA